MNFKLLLFFNLFDSSDDMLEIILIDEGGIT
jgi:hypothetical protein